MIHVGIWNRIFVKKRTEEQNNPKALVFVDYEYWFYSYQTLYGIKPDPALWRKELGTKYEVDDIMVFADFGYAGISAELPKLRTITNTVIETRQRTGQYKKDVTDFIMLDYIYQNAALRPEIDVYILFTGDGHFQSVAKYLAQRLGKKVVVCAVKGSVSRQLVAVASEFCQYPKSEEKIQLYEMFVENMLYVSRHKQIIASFNTTVDAVVNRYQVPKSAARTALSEMLKAGLIVRREHQINANKMIRTLEADWDALADAGLIEPGKKLDL